MREFNSLKMELGKDPKAFTMMEDRVAKKLRRVGKAVDEDDNNLVVLNGLVEEYTVEQRMLQRRDSEPTREHIEKVILNQYDGLRSDKSEAGAKALEATAIVGHNKPQPTHPKSKQGKQRVKFEEERQNVGSGETMARSVVEANRRKSATIASFAEIRSKTLPNVQSAGRGERERIALLTRETAVTEDPRNASDSRATNTMMPSAESLLNYTIEPERRYVVAITRNLLLVVGSGYLKIEAD